ncbi:MAG TPA: excalibur calcium-binding domain-containing protein [Luteimonas sp.]|nr:excalibur calcium-binding domain-containing protein [Luteimonas sp.]
MVAIGAGGLYVYDRFKIVSASQSVEPGKPVARAAPAASQFDPPWGQQPARSPSVASSSPYKCDGRTHCSQMRSCAEAKYFIQNCPNTRMDGDRDGVPCETQWCN